MHECIFMCVYVWYVALTSPCWMSPCPVCTCLSHPSKAIHLYLSETSIEIDSSDGMISDPSTPSSSSSEDEGPSSDDDDDGDDSDWRGGIRAERWKNWSEVSQGSCWREAQTAPVDPAEWRLGEERAAAETKATALFKNVRKSLKLSKQEQRDYNNASDEELDQKYSNFTFQRGKKCWMRASAILNLTCDFSEVKRGQ